MAFQLMAQAMKTTSDPVLAPKWLKYATALNDELAGVRSTIASISKKQAKFGQKTVLSDADLQKIVPIHPYAALVLKNIAVLFNSNQRSMFDFIISDDRIHYFTVDIENQDQIIYSKSICSLIIRLI